MLRVPSSAESKADTTTEWLRSVAVGGAVSPNLVLRMATDQNYVMDYDITAIPCYNGQKVRAKSLMNCGLPGMRIPGVLTWDVTEQIDNVVSTARIELLNALPVSQKKGTLSADLLLQYNDPTVIYNYIQDSNGVTVQVDGSTTLSRNGYNESSLQYRLFKPESIVINEGLSGWPNPRVPADESDNINNSFAPVETITDINAGNYAMGSYFILIDQEVIRVHDWNTSTGTLYIPPGGRGVNGVIQYHNGGSTVYLLGFSPFTSRWAGMGYLSSDDYRPWRSLLRPGTCLVSYEGYGDFSSSTSLTKKTWSSATVQEYEFTGYWFTKNQESSFTEDGVPKAGVDCVSAPYPLIHQKIGPEAIIRLSNQFGGWAASAFDKAGVTRAIPSNWDDFTNWDPTTKNSYPLQIKTEFAQHKAFFDHMSDSEYGKTCELCQAEYIQYVSQPNYTPGSHPIAEARVVGKHIYRESIRVDNLGGGQFDPGPVRTFLRLPIALAMACWDTPLPGTGGNTLPQRWSKIPTQLWSNLLNFNTGRVWSSQLSFSFAQEDETFLWDRTDILEDKTISWEINATNPNKQSTKLKAAYDFSTIITCPFEASYDRQEWLQPMQDLADINRMQLYFSRNGEPIFIPRGMKLRGWSYGTQFSGIDYNTTGNTGDWHMSWGQSIQNYAHNLDIDAVLTHVYVTGSTAFDSEFTIAAGGTSFDLDTGLLSWHSGKVGNKEALALTGGSLQFDTVSLDHLVLGLDWNTHPAGYGLTLLRDGQGYVQVDKLPHLPSVTDRDSLRIGDSGIQVDEIQELVNFFRKRAYIPAFRTPGENSFTELVNVTGDYDKITAAGVTQVQNFLRSAGYTINDTAGEFGPDTYLALKAPVTGWLVQNSDFVKTDIWWYAMAGYDWQYYVAAITGMSIPQNRDPEAADIDSQWIIDQLALRSTIEDWQRKFLKQAVNYGNSIVDESINKAAVRSISSNMADPRVQIGDVIWLNIPGFLSADNLAGSAQAPFDHGMYVTNVSRQMDLTAGTYRATYSGYRYRGNFDDNLQVNNLVYYRG